MKKIKELEIHPMVEAYQLKKDIDNNIKYFDNTIALLKKYERVIYLITKADEITNLMEVSDIEEVDKMVDIIRSTIENLETIKRF